MCEHHNQPRLSRRGFASLALGAAGVAALPLRANAAGHAEALALTCIDYRLVDDSVRFFDGMHLTDEYDIVALAGASLAAVSPKFPSSNAAFWDHVGIAKQLHDIQKVIVVDHRDCGAYKVAFGPDYAGTRDAETAQHKGVMLKAQAELKQKFPSLGSEFYLMALDGKAERIL
ncbi:MAG: carbonic anhydrase [Rhizomicrobium sp.]